MARHLIVDYLPPPEEGSTSTFLPLGEAEVLPQNKRRRSLGEGPPESEKVCPLLLGGATRSGTASWSGQVLVGSTRSAAVSSSSDSERGGVPEPEDDASCNLPSGTTARYDLADSLDSWHQDSRGAEGRGHMVWGGDQV